MEGTGEPIDKYEVDEMMNEGDKNQDGMLDYEGFYERCFWFALELVDRHFSISKMTTITFLLFI